MPAAAKPRFFGTPAAFRAWLAAYHGRAPELLVGFRKVGSGKPQPHLARPPWYQRAARPATSGCGR